MALKCGLVGLPMLEIPFNALTSLVLRLRIAFCVDPNLGVVEVPDPRLSALSKLLSLKKPFLLR